jgi:hypothetical protein
MFLRGRQKWDDNKDTEKNVILKGHIKLQTYKFLLEVLHSHL